MDLNLQLALVNSIIQHLGVMHQLLARVRVAEESWAKHFDVLGG